MSRSWKKLGIELFACVIGAAMVLAAVAAVTPAQAFADTVLEDSGYYIWTSGTYVAKGDVTIGDSVKVEGDVVLRLEEGSKLNVADHIQLIGSAHLTIEGTGSLEVKKPSTYYAGIGGDNSTSYNGTVEIKGGDITVCGGAHAAGIGGSMGTSAGTVIISGGTVNATGGAGSAGIGGGRNCKGGSVSISGGTVSAEGGVELGYAGAGIGSGSGGTEGVAVDISGGTIASAKGASQEDTYSGGAGIGGGSRSVAGAVTISGGTFESMEGGWWAAGIGSGSQGKGTIGDIDISGGIFTHIQGGERGAGIGSGSDTDSEKGDSEKPGRIAISGGSFADVRGGKYGAGIGGGVFRPVGNISITDKANVTVVGGKWAAGIGGAEADGGHGGIIVIGGTEKDNNPTVNATGGECGAGIGRGFNGGANADTSITIMSGTVTAQGSITKDGAQGGAGIGSGPESDGASITISGGTVKATGGEDVSSSNSYGRYGAAGIGGAQYKSSGDITISGGDVTAVGANYAAGIGSGESGPAGTIVISGGKIEAKGGSRATAIGGGEYGNGGSITISGGEISTGASKSSSSLNTVIGNGFGAKPSTVALTYSDSSREAMSVSFPSVPLDSGAVVSGTLAIEKPFEYQDDGVLVVPPIEKGRTIVPAKEPASYHAVSFDANGGTGSMQTLFVKVGETATLPACAFKNGELSFGGWSVVEGGTDVAYADQASITPEGDVALHAIWWEHKHAFTYEADGATITATCGNDDGRCDLPDCKVAITLVPPTRELDKGKGDFCATLDGTDAFNEATGQSISSKSIHYVGRDGTDYPESATAPTVAGAYSATVAVEGAVASVDYEIGALSDHFVQDGDVYTIFSERGWNYFCDQYGDFAGKTVKLGKSITISRAEAGFAGTFDGQGNTLTLDFPSGMDIVAPFRYADGYTIENLVVDGVVNTSSARAAGIVGTSFGRNGACLIRNCRSSVVIRNDLVGDKTYTGGFVGEMQNGVLALEGCVFDGEIQAAGGSGDIKASGFVGNALYGGDNLTIANSLCAPAAVTKGEDSAGIYSTFAGNCKTFGGSNCYYLTAIGGAQGKAAHRVKAGEGVTVAHAGTATVYDVSGITAYEVDRNEPYFAGIKFGGALFVGEGDVVDLTLGHGEAPSGKVFGGYVASAGELTGSKNPYELTMPASDVSITALFTAKPSDPGSTDGVTLGKVKKPTVKKAKAKSATVKWKKAAKAKGYQLQWRVKGGKWKSVSVKGLKKTVKGLKAGKTYQFRVRAVAGKSAGAWSKKATYKVAKAKSAKKVKAVGGSLSVARPSGLVAAGV